MTKWNTSNLFYKWQCTTTTFLSVLVAATLKSNRDATWHFKILHLAINSVSRTADVSHISVMAIIKSIGHGINAWYSVASASLFHLLPNGKKQLLKVFGCKFPLSQKESCAMSKLLLLIFNFQRDQFAFLLLISDLGTVRKPFSEPVWPEPSEENAAAKEFRQNGCISNVKIMDSNEEQ